jgi:hypothetical protein
LFKDVNRDNAPKGFWNYPWGKEIEEWVKIFLEGKKLVRESETPVLGELNPPKNLGIPQRNHEIDNGGLGPPSRLFFRGEGVKSEERSEWVSSVRVVKPTKNG